MPVKTFKANGMDYSFEYISVSGDPADASNYTFIDEEPIREELFYPNIGKKDVMLDIGAGFGSYSLPALAVGATVFSWSPEHEFPIIRDAFRANKFKKGHPFDFGFYSKKGYFKTDSMEFIEDGKLSMQRIYDVQKAGPAGWYIPVMTLDEWLFNVGMSSYGINKLTFIKIDAEGAELEIIKGAHKTLKLFSPEKIMIENHLFKNKAVHEELRKLLETYEYEERATLGGAQPINVTHTLYVGTGTGSAVV